jgi:hypothetical protein
VCSLIGKFERSEGRTVSVDLPDDLAIRDTRPAGDPLPVLQLSAMKWWSEA